MVFPGKVIIARGWSRKLAKLVTTEKKDSPRAKALQRELTWIRMSRGDRNELARSRIREYEQLVARETVASKAGETVPFRSHPGPISEHRLSSFPMLTWATATDCFFHQLSFIVSSLGRGWIGWTEWHR